MPCQFEVLIAAGAGTPIERTGIAGLVTRWVEGGLPPHVHHSKSDPPAYQLRGWRRMDGLVVVTVGLLIEELLPDIAGRLAQGDGRGPWHLDGHQVNVVPFPDSHLLRKTHTLRWDHLERAAPASMWRLTTRTPTGFHRNSTLLRGLEAHRVLFSLQRLWAPYFPDNMTPKPQSSLLDLELVTLHEDLRRTRPGWEGNVIQAVVGTRSGHDRLAIETVGRWLALAPFAAIGGGGAAGYGIVDLEPLPVPLPISGAD